MGFRQQGIGRIAPDVSRKQFDQAPQRRRRFGELLLAHQCFCAKGQRIIVVRFFREPFFVRLAQFVRLGLGPVHAQRELLGFGARKLLKIALHRLDLLRMRG